MGLVIRSQVKDGRDADGRYASWKHGAYHTVPPCPLLALPLVL